jgi:pyruvate/2-oxoglutarate/acetoin dehydrogenase E1 component
MTSRPKTYSIAAALNHAHHQIMEAEPRVIVIGEDIVGGAGLTGEELGGVFGVTAGLANAFGQTRVIDTPISETAFLGMGIGAAMTGLKPIVEIMFCDFMGVCFDQIMNQAAKVRFLSNDKLELPLVIRTTMGAGDGSGATHSQSLHGLLASVPGLVVVCPSNPADAAGLLKSAVASAEPVVLMEHKGLYGNSEDCDPNLPSVPIGSGRLVREGSEATLVAIGQMLHRAEAAADTLAARGISVEIIDPRTIQPLDIGMILASVQKTKRLLVVDEGPNFGGFADMVIANVVEKGFGLLRAAPQKLTPPNSPTPYGSALEEAWLVSSEQIVAKVDEMLYDE